MLRLTHFIDIPGVEPRHGLGLFRWNVYARPLPGRHLGDESAHEQHENRFVYFYTPFGVAEVLIAPVDAARHKAIILAKQYETRDVVREREMTLVDRGIAIIDPVFIVEGSTVKAVPPMNHFPA